MKVLRIRIDVLRVRVKVKSLSEGEVFEFVLTCFEFMLKVDMLRGRVQVDVLRVQVKVMLIDVLCV